MVSKNNKIVREAKLVPHQEHFTLRKLSIGFVSVLLGVTFMAYNGGDSALASMTDPAANTAETNVASVGSPEKNTPSSEKADLPKSGDVASRGTGNGVETSDVASHGTGNGVETSNKEETGTDTSVNSGANNKNSTNSLSVPQTTPTLPESQQKVQLDKQPMLTDLLSHTDDKDWIHIMTYWHPDWAYKSTVDILVK